MRALLDENMPGKLRAALSEHDVATVQYIGLGGLKNGELLNAAEAGGFDVLVTGDKSMEYEQTIAGRKIAVVALSAPHWGIIKRHVRKIAMAIETAQAGVVTRVDCGAFARHKRAPGPIPG